MTRQEMQALRKMSARWVERGVALSATHTEEPSFYSGFIMGEANAISDLSQELYDFLLTVVISEEVKA